MLPTYDPWIPRPASNESQERKNEVAVACGCCFSSAGGIERAARGDAYFVRAEATGVFVDPSIGEVSKIENTLLPLLEAGPTTGHTKPLILCLS